MTAQEWTKAFEAAFDRKPTPDEYFAEKAAGFPIPVAPQESSQENVEKTPIREKFKFDINLLKRKDNKFLLIALGVFLLLLGLFGFQAYRLAKENEERQLQIEETLLKAETAAELESMMDDFELAEAEEGETQDGDTTSEPSEESNADDPLKGKWTDSKKQALADEMVSFGIAMYQEGYQDITNEFSGKLTMVNDYDGYSTLDIEMSSDGSGSSEYRCLAVYLYQKDSILHRYFFSIRKDGSSVVLYSKDPVGTTNFTVHPTDNTRLPSSWASIVG